MPQGENVHGVVTCSECKAEQVSVAGAVECGWKSLTPGEGESEYVGQCGECSAKEAAFNAKKERIFCTCCDATAASLSKALRAGWTCLIDDEGNESGDFAGECPKCSEEQVAESISCAGPCDATADSLAAAVKAGWRDIQEDLSGLSWNYLGQCPACYEWEQTADAEHAKKFSPGDAIEVLQLLVQETVDGCVGDGLSKAHEVLTKHGIAVDESKKPKKADKKSFFSD